MKKVLFFLSLLTSNLVAADPVIYRGEVAGVFCNACSTKIKGALEKVRGVRAVKLTQSKTAGVANIEIKSTAGMSAELATHALGEDAKLFQFRGLRPVNQ